MLENNLHRIKQLLTPLIVGCYLKIIRRFILEINQILANFFSNRISSTFEKRKDLK